MSEDFQTKYCSRGTALSTRGSDPPRGAAWQPPERAPVCREKGTMDGPSSGGELMYMGEADHRRTRKTEIMRELSET